MNLFKWSSKCLEEEVSLKKEPCPEIITSDWRNCEDPGELAILKYIYKSIEKAPYRDIDGEIVFDIDNTNLFGWRFAWEKGPAYEGFHYIDFKRKYNDEGKEDFDATLECCKRIFPEIANVLAYYLPFFIGHTNPFLNDPRISHPVIVFTTTLGKYFPISNDEGKIISFSKDIYALINKKAQQDQADREAELMKLIEGA